jgi:hypothetical protein
VIYKLNSSDGTSLSAFGIPGGVNYLQDSSTVGFTDALNNNYALSPNSSYKNKGLDGRDLGADIQTINALTSGVDQVCLSQGGC